MNVYFLNLNIEKKDQNFIFKELKKYQNMNFKKTKTYKFKVLGEEILIESVLDRIFIRTLKWIEDIVDKILRKKNQTFSIEINKKSTRKIMNPKIKNKIIFNFCDKNVVNSLNQLSDIILNYKTFKNKIIFEFDFESKFIESKTITLKTENGNFYTKTYEVTSHNKTFLVSWKGNLDENINLRIHHMCLTSEILDSLHCDCKMQLENYKKIMKDQGGLLIYAYEEGRGLGITKKINAYHNTEILNLDTVEAMNKEAGISEARKFDMAGEILRKLGVKSVNIFTNNPLKIYPIKDRNIKVNIKNAWTKLKTQEQKKYIETKIKKMGHKKND